MTYTVIVMPVCSSVCAHFGICIVYPFCEIPKMANRGAVVLESLDNFIRLKEFVFILHFSFLSFRGPLNTWERHERQELHQ